MATVKCYDQIFLKITGEVYNLFIPHYFTIFFYADYQSFHFFSFPPISKQNNDNFYNEVKFLKSSKKEQFECRKIFCTFYIKTAEKCLSFTEVYIYILSTSLDIHSLRGGEEKKELYS